MSYRNENSSFKECSICAAKPGSPTLCPSCLHNRRIIYILSKKPIPKGKHLHPGIFYVGGYKKLLTCSKCGLTENFDSVFSSLDFFKPCPKCGSQISSVVGKWIKTGFLKGYWEFKGV